uniref:Uncharacterized protein n=1 Tax=Sphaerodactylus townsendi TaxID=933632 RepID=A0ACB8G7T1_9SAUR
MLLLGQLLHPKPQRPAEDQPEPAPRGAAASLALRHPLRHGPWEQYQQLRKCTPTLPGRGVTQCLQGGGQRTAPDTNMPQASASNSHPCMPTHTGDRAPLTPPLAANAASLHTHPN